VLEIDQTITTLPEPLKLESGVVLTRPRVAWKTWGQLNATRDNAVLICHALSGSADVDAWWPGIIGANGAFDPARDFVIASNVLGGCYGSSGPREDEFPGLAFPQITIGDMVELQARLVEHLGVRALKLVVGASMGGMQALEWAVRYPAKVRAIAPLCCPARQSAQALALNALQIRAIQADPVNGLKLARQMGLLTYRSFEDFESRFDRSRRDDGHYQVLSYLDYQGDKFVARFDPVSYVRLTEAMINWDLGVNRGGTAAALAGISQPAFVLSIESDQLYLPREQAYLAAHLPNAQLHLIDSRYGHDGFLVELATVSRRLRDFLDQTDAALRAA
jgi:homoserine O-acetyltransferase/O-succinyltransferase